MDHTKNTRQIKASLTDISPQEMQVRVAGKSKALEKLGRFEEARDCYEQAKELEVKTHNL